jgi:hypothetical protein
MRGRLKVAIYLHLHICVDQIDTICGTWSWLRCCCTREGQGMRPISLKYSWSNAFLAVIRWLGSKINVFCSILPTPKHIRIRTQLINLGPINHFSFCVDHPQDSIAWYFQQSHNQIQKSSMDQRCFEEFWPRANQPLQAQVLVQWTPDSAADSNSSHLLIKKYIQDETL